MKFKLSLVDDTKEEMQGNHIVADTAKNLPVFQSEPINCIEMNNGLFLYNTGFSDIAILKNNYYTEEEKQVLLKRQKEDAKRVAKELFGSEKKEIEATNSVLWGPDRFGKIELNNATSTLIYDTRNLDHLILYWQIMCDAYSLVGCNKERAEHKNSPYFIQELAEADLRENSDETDKINAITIVGNLMSNNSSDSLLYLCWSLGTRKDKMGGFTKATSVSTLGTALLNFINGNTRDKNKRACVKEFLNAHAEFTKDKDMFMIKVVVKIADYHQLIVENKDGNYVTNSGEVLGRTVKEMADKLSKPIFRDIFEALMQEVMLLLNNDL